MLESALWVIFVMAWQVHLAIFADDLALPVGDDRGVETTPLRCQLGVTECHRHTEVPGTLEQRHGGGIGHLGFEPCIHFFPIRHVPAGKKRGQREFGIDDYFGTTRGGLLQQFHHAGNYNGPAITFLNGAELSAGNDQSRHENVPSLMLPITLRGGVENG
ncbi:hypothetical protein QE369_000072 [Agrobacterium larrymoorei]|uniref:Uncharacterized protein n=1 Tax=Agrobacterium larrymoorei TaxID=160699 RepID=A0AAJ2EPW4_9HYPH|nr:hypothetical protein [Agrobacterium larrymoorei]